MAETEDLKQVTEATKALPTALVPRFIVLCSVVFGIATLFVYLAGDASLMADHPQHVLGLMAAVSFGIQVVAWVPAAIMQTEKFYDLTGSITYFFVSIVTLLVGSKVDFEKNIFDQLQTRNIVLTCMVLVWCCRLGSFLFMRISHDNVDHRFDGIRDVPLRFLNFWMVQGLWVIITGLPVFTLNAYGQTVKEIGWVDYVAWSVWGVGFLIEVVADRQKSAFRARKTGKWIDEGLWYYSRHPNYFGEIMLWTGAFIGVTPILNNAQWAVAISPVFVWFLLAKVSGIPLLEPGSERKWGDQIEFQLYKRNTQPIMIWFKGKVGEEDEGIRSDLLAASQKSTSN